MHLAEALPVDDSYHHPIQGMIIEVSLLYACKHWFMTIAIIDGTFRELIHE